MKEEDEGGVTKLYLVSYTIPLQEKAYNTKGRFWSKVGLCVA